MITASSEQIEVRKEALELAIGYVDRSVEWWTDYLENPTLALKIQTELLDSLWIKFESAVSEVIWRMPTELIAHCDLILKRIDLEKQINGQTVHKRVGEAKKLLENYCEDSNLTARFQAALDAMAPDAKEACIEVTNWLAFERAKDAEPATEEDMQAWIEEVMRRRRAATKGKGAQILPFSRKRE